MEHHHSNCTRCPDCKTKFQFYCEFGGCGKQESVGGEFKFCSGCHLVKYCSTTCQLAHWKYAHKIQCKKQKSDQQDEKKDEIKISQEDFETQFKRWRIENLEILSAITLCLLPNQNACDRSFALAEVYATKNPRGVYEFKMQRAPGLISQNITTALAQLPNLMPMIVPHSDGLINYMKSTAIPLFQKSRSEINISELSKQFRETPDGPKIGRQMVSMLTISCFQVC